ncbi:MAG: DUF4340 domain-containing protein [Candidatus Omnitrophica bacterium]|nr:DUF4340 domain-containing protein [Candidatus Omnitrophota bacterium]
MKLSTTIVFTALFLVVGGSYFYLKPTLGPETPKDTPIPLSLRVLPLEKDDDVTWLQIQNFSKKETITLIKDGENWKMKFPVQGAADPLIVKGLISALKLSAKQRVLLPERGWEEYGLVQPQIKVGIETLKNKGRKYLSFGNLSPVGEKVFARWEGEKDYFLLNQDLLRAFDRSAYSLRWKQIFRILPEKITKIFVRTKKTEYEMVRRDGTWFWLQPVDIAGDKVRREFLPEIILRLAQLYIKDFLDQEKGPPAKFGVISTSPAVRVWGEAKEYEALEIGKEIPAKDAFYGRREGEETYFFMARGNVQDFFKRIEEIADAKPEKA